MKRFEYLTKNVHFAGRNPADDTQREKNWDGLETEIPPSLAELGAQGWELIHIQDYPDSGRYSAVFKRETSVN